MHEKGKGERRSWGGKIKIIAQNVGISANPLDKGDRSYRQKTFEKNYIHTFSGLGAAINDSFPL